MTPPQEPPPDKPEVVITHVGAPSPAAILDALEAATEALRQRDKIQEAA